MEEYNIQDVQLTEALYLEMRPWIKNHPNLSIDSLATGIVTGKQIGRAHV